MAATRMVGTVSGIHREKGFFFICGPDDVDYFAMARDLPDHRSIMSLVSYKTRIEFTPEDRAKGPAAADLVMADDNVGNQ